MKHTGPVHFHWYGDVEAAKGYIPTARLLLGRCSLEMFQEPRRYPGISDSAMHKRLEVTSADYMVRNRTFPNGVAVHVVLHHEGMAAAHIFHPTGAPEVDAVEIRGLLRAIQAEVDYECTENPTPEEIAAAAELETPIEPFSTLETLHDPNDQEKQWLVYPDGVSIEFNPFSNHVLPPQGGTFIMDIIAAPFNPIAFDINGKPPLTSCKMLVTGGGTVQEDGSYMFGEVVEGVRVRELAPRVFRVGRKNEMPGWPWADKRDPETPFGRLVSLSAVLEHTPNVASNAHHNKVTFTLTFLKLNGEECTGEDEELGYECLDPVEVVVELDDSLYIWADHPYTATHWVDFAVLSLLPDGSGVVIGMNQLGQAGYIGPCYDFIVLDLARIIADPLDFDLYSRFDTWWGSTSRTVSNSGQLTNMARVYEDPAPIDLDPIVIPAGLGNYTVGNRNRVELVDTFEDITYPTERVETKSHDFTACVYMHFGHNGELYETYAHVTETQTTTQTQVSTPVNFVLASPDDGKGHYGRRHIRLRTWQIGAAYVRGAVVTIPQIISGETYRNVYITLEDHTATNDDRPGLEWNGTHYVDRTGSKWKMVYGDRLDNEIFCGWATWNGVDDCTPTHPDTDSCFVLDALSTGSPPSWDILYLGEGASRTPVWARPVGVGQGSLYEHQMEVTQEIATTTYSDLYQRKLDMLAETVPAMFAGRDHTVDARIIEVTNLATHTAETHTKTRHDNKCIWQADGVSYPVARWQRFMNNQTHSLSDTASLDTLVHGGGNFSMPAYSAAVTRGNGWGIESLVGPIFEPYDASPATYKAEVFTGSRFGQISVFPVGGIGWLAAIGARSTSNAGTVPDSTSQVLSSGAQRNKCVITVGSKWAFTEVDDTNPWESHSIIAGLRPDVDNGPSFTNPLPYIKLGLDEAALAAEGDPEAMLKPVRGPEKGVGCLQQQISYVGWLYPQELEAPEE